jgi:hypothetical protein
MNFFELFQSHFEIKKKRKEKPLTLRPTRGPFTPSRAPLLFFS